MVQHVPAGFDEVIFHFGHLILRGVIVTLLDGLSVSIVPKGVARHQSHVVVVDVWVCVLHRTDGSVM